MVEVEAKGVDVRADPDQSLVACNQIDGIPSLEIVLDRGRVVGPFTCFYSFWTNKIQRRLNLRTPGPHLLCASLTLKTIQTLDPNRVSMALDPNVAS